MKILAVWLMALVMLPATASDLVPSELIGQWLVDPTQQIEFPKECRPMQIIITPDGKFRDSGGPGHYSYSSKIEVRASTRGYFIDQSRLSHNNLPNCQGLSADYVSSHFKPDIYVELEGDRLRYFFWEPESSTFLDYHRVSGAP